MSAKQKKKIMVVGCDSWDGEMERRMLENRNRKQKPEQRRGEVTRGQKTRGALL